MTTHILDFESAIREVRSSEFSKQAIEEAKESFTVRNQICRDIRMIVDAFDLSWDELVEKRTLPVKYRDDHGNAWSGVGKTPNWLQVIPQDQWDNYRVEGAK